MTYGLSFVQAWHNANPQWLAKDIIVLFYDDSTLNSQDDTNNPGQSYSESVGEFLKNYYKGYDHHNVGDLKDLLDDEQVI